MKKRAEALHEGIRSRLLPSEDYSAGEGFCQGPSFNGHWSCSAELCLWTALKKQCFSGFSWWSNALLETSCRGQEVHEQKEPKKQGMLQQGTPSQVSTQGTKAHSCWPEGPGDPPHPAPAAPKNTAAPRQHRPPLLPRVGYEPGEGGGSEAAQTIGKVITTAHPHDASDKMMHPQS